MMAMVRYCVLLKDDDDDDVDLSKYALDDSDEDTNTPKKKDR